jgi:aspartate carbamoyltransferase catalytic subunit
MPAEITANLKNQNVEIIETHDLAKAISESDVVYMTRIQKERFEDPAEYERLKGSFELDLNMVKKAKKGLTIMHPLPRVTEIATDVDGYEGAAYFRQAGNGVPVRMALLALVTGND